MRYLSIDASTKSTGIAIFDDNILQSHDCLTASSTDVIKRITKIINQLDRVIQFWKPDIIILEEVIPKDSGDDVKTVQTRRVLMWLQAAINFLCHENYPNIKIDYIYPNEWRSWIGVKTGAGVHRESLKAKDIAWVQENFGLTLNDDEADAIGICCGYQKKQSGEPPKETKRKGAW